MYINTAYYFIIQSTITVTIKIQKNSQGAIRQLRERLHLIIHTTYYFIIQSTITVNIKIYQH